jgi:endo-beta-N-acetylglucosaminidase D
MMTNNGRIAKQNSLSDEQQFMRYPDKNGLKNFVLSFFFAYFASHYEESIHVDRTDIA